MQIAIDAMGGEFGLQTTIPGIQKAIQELHDPQLHFLIFGQKDLIEPLVELYGLTKSVEIIDVEAVVQDTDHPFRVFQVGDNTSMGKALSAVVEGAADGVVSSGSTGGYVTLAHKIFGLMPQVAKIALPAVVPNHKGQSIFLDAGASIAVSEADLVQFAVMGSLLYKVQFDAASPRVSILNMGTEEIKGPPFVRKAHGLLKQNHLVNYQGFIEGTNIFNGDVDVIVTDGYAGNIALKVMEGIANFAGENLKQALGGSWWRKILSLSVFWALRPFKEKMDRRRYNGVVLLGLNHLAIKSHGDADAEAFASAIRVAYKMIQHKLIDQMRASFEAAYDRSPGSDA